MTCKPSYVGPIKYMREHPPALQVKTRGATDQWGFFYLKPPHNEEVLDKKNARGAMHTKRAGKAL